MLGFPKHGEAKHGSENETSDPQLDRLSEKRTRRPKVDRLKSAQDRDRTCKEYYLH